MSTDISVTATELMRGALGEAREEYEEAVREGEAALTDGNERDAYRASCSLADLRERMEDLRDELEEVLSFARDHISDFEDLISGCEERETALEEAYDDEDDEEGDDG